jgi:hypothetical protein
MNTNHFRLTAQIFGLLRQRSPIQGLGPMVQIRQVD